MFFKERFRFFFFKNNLGPDPDPRIFGSESGSMPACGNSLLCRLSRPNNLGFLVTGSYSIFFLNKQCMIFVFGNIFGPKCFALCAKLGLWLVPNSTATSSLFPNEYIGAAQFFFLKKQPELSA